MLQDSINNLCCNPLVLEKKIGETSKKLFGLHLHKKKVIMGHIQDKKTIFLAEITNADYQLSKKINFIKTSYVFAEL